MTVRFRVKSAEICVNVSTRDALMAAITARLQARQGFALATLNLDHLVKMRQDPAFLEAYQAQDLVVADGNPIVWLSRIAHSTVELMPGSDLVIPLCRAAAEVGATVALLGSTETSLRGAADALTAQVKGLEVVRTIAPAMGFDPTGAEARTILEDLQSSGIGLCFIALGAPKQELLAAYGRSAAPDVGFASIGAGLDFLSGHQKRAPRWVRALALEWLWRLMTSPKRMFGRYARCAVILPRLIVRARRQRNSD